MERKKFIPDKNWAETHFETIRDELGLDTPYTFQELRSLLREHRRSWQVPKHYHYELIVDELCGKKLLHRNFRHQLIWKHAIILWKLMFEQGYKYPYK